MKIRRALTAAAAAAVLAPATVLAAPAAAFAAEQVSGTAPRTPAAPGAGTAGGSDDAGRSCAFESDQLRTAVKGLPHELAAGGAWSTFSLTLTNTTAKPLTKVLPFLHLSSSEAVDRPYWELDTEYHDARTGKWKTFHDASPEDLFGFFTIKPGSTLTLELRTRAVKNAKPGAGYALAAGDYRNDDGSCGSAKEAWYDFTLLPAGTKPTRPPSSGPGTPGGTSGPGHGATSGGGTGGGSGSSGGGTGGGSGSSGGPGPQGGGHLATTGSASALPVALAGGAALAVGAGAVVAVRRRKGAAGPGAADVSA
ncbi:LPXTG cell wall anchor domain-containing protein [Streptomyces sp. NPDC014733]|uniref:LPXTG cell wall anchor domain-containing protein n=1 Tax=Streptomyces sp. NPDC014733 TaxID=3364885 RepID=UPI0037008E93